MNLRAHRRAVQLAGAVVIVAATAWIAATTPGFLTLYNFTAVLSSVSLIGIVAVGATFILLSGNFFSLSLGATAAVAAMVFLGSLRLGVVAAVLISIVIGAAIGAIYGALVGWWSANPILTTIAGAAVMQGLATWLTEGRSILPTGGSDAYKVIANTRLLDLPIQALIFIGVCIVAQATLQWTRFGRRVYLIGENKSAARSAALPIGHIITIAFVISGICAAFVGIINSAQNSVASLDMVGTYDYDAVAGILVGGNLVTGGSGSVVRTVIGVIAIGVFSDLLLLRGYPLATQVFGKGILVVVAILLTNFEILGGRKR